ncbi:hypothetical protein ACQE3E_06500 [Methylomonas sp. MED-D]|uniref:hypothetical protein n=1 Tax=Methylomonas sp. MED-D TaxID=3418768 RepID=UPI003D0187C9
MNDQLRRITASAYQIAQANAIANPDQVRQITGLLVEKICDGLDHAAALEAARHLAHDLRDKNRRSAAVTNLLADINQLALFRPQALN